MNTQQQLQLEQQHTQDEALGVIPHLLPSSPSPLQLQCVPGLFTTFFEPIQGGNYGIGRSVLRAATAAPAPTPAPLFAYKIMPFSEAAVNELAIQQHMAVGCAHCLPLVAVFDNMLDTNDAILKLVGKAKVVNPPQQQRFLIAVMPVAPCDALDLLKQGYYSEEKQEAVHLNVAQITEIGRQMAEALAHIHSMGYIHADFKLENVLVLQMEPTIHICVCDFGFSRPINAPCVNFQHTPPYVAPEMVRAYITRLLPTIPVCMGASIDMWALGVCMYMLHVRNHPFAMRNNQTHAPLEVLMRGCPKQPLVARGVSQANIDLIDGLLNPVVEHRLCAGAAVKRLKSVVM